MSSSAPPAESPPAKKRWTRSTELEFTVYPRDAVIVAQTDDPALDPLSNGSLGIKPVLIRSKGDRAQAVVAFDVANSLPVPISFDVSLRVGGQTITCGTLWAVRTPGGGSSSGEEMTVELDRLDPEIRAADVVLTPNPTPVEQRTSVDRIWGREIVFHQVRLIRQDLGEAATSVGPTAPALSQDTAIGAILDYGGFVKTNAEGRVFRISLVYDEDAQGNNRRECAGTSDAIAQWFPAFPELEELWLFGSQATDQAIAPIIQAAPADPPG